MLIQVAVVILALALWLWLVVDCAHLIVHLARGRCEGERSPVLTKKRVALAAPFILVVAFAITHRLHQEYPDVERTPLPCVGDGVDYDVRDGLCYKHVPLKFQRR